MPREKKPTAVELLNRNKGRVCGECKFFADESTDGTGLCVVRKTTLVKFCGDKACAWFKERLMV